jgi:hypothetical protein
LSNMIVFGNDETPEITFFGNSSVFDKVDPVTKVKFILFFTIEKRCVIVYREKSRVHPVGLPTAPSTYSGCVINCLRPVGGTTRET